MLFINDHIAELSEEQTERLISSLPEWRREQALRYKFLQGRRECAVAYVELLRGLRQQFGIYEKPVFSYNEHGKPYISQHPQVHFSLSHCKEAVGCFLGNLQCGFDVECVRTAKEDLVRHTMNKEEAESIFSSPSPDVAFTRLWTQKEAVLKLKGTGIIDDLHSVLSPANLQGIKLQVVENPSRGYVFSIAERMSEC